MNSNHRPKKRKFKQKRMYLPTDEIPHKEEFEAFVLALQELKADKDVVRSKKREYVYTSMVYPVYRKTFGDKALQPHSIMYRIKNLNKKRYRDDFYILEDTLGPYEPKYIINRLNKQLLLEVYLPTTGDDIYLLRKQTSEMEQNFLYIDEIDFPDEEDDF